MGNPLTYSLSPLDNRYTKTTTVLTHFFSEAALITVRTQIEVSYLLFLSQQKIAPSLTAQQMKMVSNLSQVTPKDITQIKKIESVTHHDVKAVEYFLQKKLVALKLPALIPFIHFGLTSEDINNISYRQLVSRAQTEVLLPQLYAVLSKLTEFAHQHRAQTMLARTHGQSALPTTLGKELSVFVIRIMEQLQALESVKLTGKLNGAVGSFQALHFAFPQHNWIQLSQQFIESLGLTHKLHTTQINPPDDLVDLFAHYHHLNSILVGLNQDIWRYISDNWFAQKGKQNLVGSSTMPQKINPIEFENSEGNLHIANSLFEGFNRKLPISRLQRDLSDSTVMRNIGVAFGHCLVAYHSLDRGLSTIAVNSNQIQKDLFANWSILAEAMNTLGRKQRKTQAYEQAASTFKGRVVTQSEWQSITTPIDTQLVNLTPNTYIGLATQLTDQAVKQATRYLKQKGYHG